MDIKKHLSCGVLLLAALVLMGSIADRYLFASADTTIRGIFASDAEVTAVTPTNTQTLSLVDYRSATPTNSSFFTVSTITSNSYADVEIYEATPTNTQTQSAYGSMSSYEDAMGMDSIKSTSAFTVKTVQEEPIYTTQPVPVEPVYVQAIDPEPEVEDVVEPEYDPSHVTHLAVNIPVITNATGGEGMDGFMYRVEYLSSSDSTAVPELPDDKTVVMLSGEISTFQSIYFTEPGQYYFKVEQDRSNNALNLDKGYSWNDTWYFVGITVTEGEFGLESSITSYQVGSGGVCTPCGSVVTFTQVHT